MQKSTISWEFFLGNINKAYPQQEVELNPGYIQEFYFIESIENSFLIGEMTIVDTGGFLATLPFTGDESIKVIATQSIEDPEDNKKSIDIIKKVEFDIWKTEIVESSLLKKVVKLSLLEKEAYGFIATNRSLGYKNKLISEIITDVLIKQSGLKSDDIEVEKTNEQIDFTIPFWPPMVTVKHLIRKAKRAKYPYEAGFLLFTTTGGRTRTTPIKKCCSFASLLEQKIDLKDDKNKYFVQKMDANQFFINTIKDLKQPNLGTRSVLKDGITGKRYFGVNYNNDKNIIQEKKLYTDFFNESFMLGKVSLFPSSIDDYHGDIEFIGGTTNMIQARQDFGFRMLLEGCYRKDGILEGNLERYCGQIIYIEQSSDNADELYHRQDSGKWLIKEITHYLSHGQFTQRVIILKDTYNESDLKGHPTK